MALPNRIPAGARIVVRVSEGVDPADGRVKFRDYVGHVRSWDGRTLELLRTGTTPAAARDIAANHGRARPGRDGHIDFDALTRTVLSSRRRVTVSPRRADSSSVCCQSWRGMDRSRS